ncbi:ABC transporter ATP-binding protein [Halorussus salilacus]|uniref:ABC transporter ATP-binding protein n=1 Tax=Halorussus salilacus TaxID=2953750 RepID=UPI00209F432B|nr:ABC transporter ATP-binding protein [Halorussus salilacus]USZ68144.1 ABC transporter ATP-binding protein [Halorussus salilacus]
MSEPVETERTPETHGTGEPILEVEDLRKTFGGITAVDGATFEVEEGTITGLIGPNGAGKTTTFNLISGFYRPDDGGVRYRGTDLQEIMRPSGTEQGIWMGASGLSFGGAGVAAAAAAGVSTVGLGVGAVVGAGLGAGVYQAQERVKSDLLDHEYSRPFRVSKAGLSRTFQITRELQGMTVLENLMLAPQDQRGERIANAWFRRSAVAAEEDEVRERAVEMLEFLELDHLANEYAGNLSGGQRKLLELGRVLMTDPDLILLDEPVAGVNPALTEKLLERIESLRERGYTFCIVEHDMEVIMNLSDTVIVMDQGKKLMEGTPEEVQSDQRVVDAYLGG